MRDNCRNCIKHRVGGPSDSMDYTSVSMPVYRLGVLGAAVYYIQRAATFWLGVPGILKALVWPAMRLYRVLEMLKMQCTVGCHCNRKELRVW